MDNFIFGRFRCLAVFALVGAFSGSRLSGQTTISIPNSGFESPSTGVVTSFSGADWQESGGANVGLVAFAILKSGPDRYPSAGAAPDGTQLGFINVGYIYQDLSATYLAGTTYTFSGYIGTRTDDAGAAGSFNLMDGATVLATSGVIAPASGTFQFGAVSYTASAGVDGHTIRVQIIQETAFQVNFDAVQLTAIPEPATCAAVFGSLALGAAALRRRSNRISAAR